MLTLKLTTAELELIIHTLLQLREDGWYYGNKEQFYGKRDVLLEKLKQLGG